jgi:hypothetical protein
MLVLALALVFVPLAWLLAKRARRAEPAVRRALVAGAILCVAAAVAVRAGPVGVGLFLLAVVWLAVWLRSHGSGGEGPGDDGREPPEGPEPDPGPRATLRPESLDDDAFDRARAQWEQELPKRG